MSLPTRKQARLALGSAMKADLEGEGRPFTLVSPHWVGDFGGQSPVLVLASKGTRGERSTFKGGRAAYIIEAHVFVLQGEGAPGADYSESDADDGSDDTSEMLRAWVSDHPTGITWKSLTYQDFSQLTAVVFGGHTYWHEITPLLVEVF